MTVRFLVVVKCGICCAGNQNYYIDLPENDARSDLRGAIYNQTLVCHECGSQDLSLLGYADVVPEATL